PPPPPDWLSRTAVPGTSSVMTLSVKAMGANTKISTAIKLESMRKRRLRGSFFPLVSPLIDTFLEKRLRSVFRFVLTFDKFCFIALSPTTAMYLLGRVAPNGDAKPNEFAFHFEYR